MSIRRRLETEVISAARTYVHTQQGYADLFNAIEALDQHLDPIRPEMGAYGRNSPETSKKAAAQATLLQGSVRRRIIDEIYVITMINPDIRGCTDDELERSLKSRHTTVSSARNWLVNHGWLTDSGYRRQTSSGRDAIVWSLTGRALYEIKPNS